MKSSLVRYGYPGSGSDVGRLQDGNAAALGFAVPPRPDDYGPGQIPPSTNCTSQQLGLP